MQLNKKIVQMQNDPLIGTMDIILAPNAATREDHKRPTRML